MPEQRNFRCRGCRSPWLARQDPDRDLESVPLQGPSLGKKNKIVMATAHISSRKGRILFVRAPSLCGLFFFPRALGATRERGEELSTDTGPRSQPSSFYTPICELHTAASVHSRVASRLSCIPLSKASFLKCSFKWAPFNFF